MTTHSAQNKVQRIQTTKTKRSIFFAMSLDKAPQDWTEADFARECIQYCERRAQLESLKADQEAHKHDLLTWFRENTIKDFTVLNHTITATSQTKKSYSRKCQREEERLKEQIKAMKVLEEESGVCEIQRNEYNHISVKSSGEIVV